MEIIRILIIEHDINDLNLLLHVLNESKLNYIQRTVETRKRYEEELVNFKPQIILAEHTLPAFDGTTAYNIKQKISPETPFIIISGSIGEENAVELVKQGITDYVVKKNIYQVIFKIQRALKEASDYRQKIIAELELKQSREQLQKIMDESLDMICILNDQGRFVEVSAASNQILGYSPEELRGMSAWDLIFPGDIKKTEELISDTLAGIRPAQFENRYVRKNGEIVPIFWSISWSENQRLAYCVARDASSIKRAETELKEHTEQIKNILENITDGFLSLNSEWKITYWNREAEYILGAKQEDMIGQNVWEVFREAVSLRFYTEYHHVMNHRVSSSFEEYFPPLKAWIGVNAYPSKDGISIFFRDTTEIKRIQSINDLQRNVLEFYTKRGSRIEEAIMLLLKGIQEIHPELFCSTLKLENDKLYFWVFPHLPESFINAGKFRVGDDGGTGGMAAFFNERVAVTDIPTDPLFKNLQDLSAEYNLKASVSYPICDPDKKILGIFAVFLNTTRALTNSEEKSLESALYVLHQIMDNHINEIALKESEEKYRDLFHLSPIPIWVYDPETLKFLKVNEAAIRHYGYNREEFQSMTIRDIRPHDALESLQDVVESSKKHLSFFQGTFDHLKKNGELIKVLIQSNLISFGSGKARIVLAVDITEKLKFETSLQLSEKRFKALVQEGSELINIIDVAGNIKYTSPASAGMVGHKPEALLENNVLDFIHEDEKVAFLNALSSLLKNKRLKTLPFRLKDIKGGYRWVQSIMTNLLTDPAIQGIVVNSRDITESVNHIQAIEDQNSQLQEIAWMQSHVVRAPLVRIMGLIDLVRNYPNDKESLDELLDYILTSAHDLDSVIKTIVKKSELAENITAKK